MYYDNNMNPLNIKWFERLNETPYFGIGPTAGEILSSRLRKYLLHYAHNAIASGLSLIMTEAAN